MGDFQQHPVEVIQYAGDGGVAGVGGGLAVQAAFADQVGRAFLLGGIRADPLGLALTSSNSTICERSR